MAKIYVDANRMMLDSFELAKNIYNSNYIPNDIIGVLEGGIFPAFYIKRYFTFMGKNVKEYLIPTSKTTKMDKTRKNIDFKMIELINAEINNDVKNKRNILLVDDVIYTGHTLENIIKNLKSNMKEIKIATIYYNSENNETRIKPDFYLYKCKKEDLIVFPYRLEEIEVDEIKGINNDLHKILTT